MEKIFLDLFPIFYLYGCTKTWAARQRTGNPAGSELTGTAILPALRPRILSKDWCSLVNLDRVCQTEICCYHRLLAGFWLYLNDCG